MAVPGCTAVTGRYHSRILLQDNRWPRGHEPADRREAHRIFIVGNSPKGYGRRSEAVPLPHGRVDAMARAGRRSVVENGVAVTVGEKGLDTKTRAKDMHASRS